MKYVLLSAWLCAACAEKAPVPTDPLVSSAAELSADASMSASPTPSGGVGTLGHGSGVGVGGRPWVERSRLPPSIRKGPTTVVGALEPELVERSARGGFRKLRTCYEEALMRDPKLAGRASLAYEIRADGTTKDTTISSDMKDAGFIACVRDRFAELVYPPPKRGVVKVTYPILFAPPEYAFTIHGKTSSQVQVEDVKAALQAKGYVVGAVEPKAGFEGVSTLIVKKDALDFLVTVDPHRVLEGGTPGTHFFSPRPSPEFERLEKEGVVLSEGLLFISAEGADGALMLINAITKMNASPKRPE